MEREFRVSFGGRRERGERGVAAQYRPDRSVIGSIRLCREETILWFVFEFCVFSLSLCFI